MCTVSDLYAYQVQTRGGPSTCSTHALLVLRLFIYCSGIYISKLLLSPNILHVFRMNTPRLTSEFKDPTFA